MQFIEFPVSATNIFPLSNSTAGGQILTEFNIRSRETVATDPTIEYKVGPSYAHSEQDFAISCLADGASIPSTAIQIQPGRAIVNGHYVELLTPIVIDLATVNFKAAQEGVAPLKGDLAIGLVMMYSTYTTLAASALPENADGYYEGVRVVIVPEADVKRPIDVPKQAQMEDVNMHLLLGKFTFFNGTVSNVHQDEDKLRVFDASRVGNLSNSLSSEYVSKVGLDPNSFYVFAGKGTLDDKDTWCAAQDSLMVWDTHPQLLPDIATSDVAHFEYNKLYGASGDVVSGATELVVPHKQIDYAVDEQGRRVYFPDKRYAIPNATFSPGSGGVVSPAYTKRILHIEEKLNQIYRLPNGVMRKYLTQLTIDPHDTSKYGEDGALPEIPIGEGSVQPLDIDTVIQQIISTINEVSSDISTSCGSVETVIGTLNQVVANLGDSAGLASRCDDTANDIASTLNNVYSALDSLVTGGSPSGALAACIEYLDSALTELRKSTPNVSVAEDDISTAKGILSNDVVGTVGTSYTQVGQCYQDLVKNDGLISKLENLRTEISTEQDSVGTAITALRSIIGTASQSGTLQYCITKLGQVVTTISSLSDTITQYIDQEVQRRLDEQTVLKETVWSPGDYVLVAQDATQPVRSDGTYPSTMYVVNYGQIETVTSAGSLSITINEDDADKYKKLDLFRHKVPVSPINLAGGVELEYNTIVNETPTPTDITNLNFTQYYGAVKKDYFVMHYEKENYQTIDGQEVLVSKTYTNFFYTPSSTKLELTYALPPILVTGGVPIATTEAVGGFIATPEDAYGNGYVTVDPNGHLRVVDYNYLVMGLRAQQLEVDVEVGSGLDISAIQTSLDDSVNDRICYPNDDQRAISDANNRDPNSILLTLDVPSVTEESVIHIHDIGTRAGGYLYVKILGSATSATTIIFENCDKLRIDDTIIGQPNIVLKNVNLYYSSNVLDKAGAHSSVSTITGIENLKLWYERDYNDSSSPDLQVDGMTVTLLSNIENTSTFDPWSADYPNDNHYSYALRSITFAGDGSIIGARLLVSDDSTPNVVEVGKTISRANFTLPQNSGLSYPSTKLTRRIKIVGSFVSSYWSTSNSKYVMKETNFSALTSTAMSSTPGSIAFCTNTYLVSSIIGVGANETIDCWALHTLNIFQGGAID